jgi:alpha-L-fucosidase
LGDYQTPEQFIPNAIPTKGVRFNAVDTSVQQQLKPMIPRPEDFQMWETCMTINNTWAYNIHDREYKSSQFLIRALVEVASRGGNFLLNVGQQPDGVIPENTRPETLMQAAEIGKTAGLRYVAWSATGRTRVA